MRQENRTSIEEIATLLVGDFKAYLEQLSKVWRGQMQTYEGYTSLFTEKNSKYRPFAVTIFNTPISPEKYGKYKSWGYVGSTTEQLADAHLTTEQLLPFVKNDQQYMLEIYQSMLRNNHLPYRIKKRITQLELYTRRILASSDELLLQSLEKARPDIALLIKNEERLWN